MVEVNGVNVSLGKLIIGVLTDMQEFPKHKWDFVNLVVGDVGDGKTTFVQLASYYLDPNVNIDRWAYNAEQFEKIVDSDLPVGSNIIWDESDELTDAWNSRIIQTMSRKFKRIRKKRYVIWLITPTMFDLRKYFVITRARCLWDVYAEPKRNADGKFEANRGSVRFFNKEKKRLLYIRGIKEWDMKAVLPNWHDRFGIVPEGYPIKEEELEAKKDAAMVNMLQEADKAPVRQTMLRAEYVSRFEQWHWSNVGRKALTSDVSWIFKISERQVRRDKEAFDRKFAANGGDVSVLDANADKLLNEHTSSQKLPKMKGAEPQ